MRRPREPSGRGLRGARRATTATAATSTPLCPAQSSGSVLVVTAPARVEHPPTQLRRRLMQRRLRRSAHQQWAAITRAARARPWSIAGAGSGKTTVMAARVVWLVATGQVRPDQVLGLTFTTKATAELATRIRDALRAGRAPARRAAGGPSGEEAEDGRGADGGDLQRLRRGAAHRARPADRPRARHPADRRRVALPARRRAPSRGTPRAVRHLSDAPAARRSSTCSPSTAS